MREIDIEWRPLGISVTAVLTGDKNPGLAELLWDALPYRSLQNHALVSGHHLYHLVPDARLVHTPAEHKEDRTRCADGTVFLSQLQHMAVKYGPLSEYLPAAAVGHVRPEDVDALRAAGRACWEAAYRTKEPVEVRVTRKGEPAAEFPLRAPEPIGHPEVQRLITEIHDEVERVWTDPPAEITEVHAGRSPSRAGSYDQYLSTLVFVNGETRPLGYCGLNGLLRLAQDPSVDLAALRRITPEFTLVPAEFLGYCGLGRLCEFVRRTVDLLDVVIERAEYTALIRELALYANCLNTWNLHYFPWRHGDEYPYADAATAAVPG